MLQYFDKTSEVFDKLIMGNRSHDFLQARLKLQKLEKSQSMLGIKLFVFIFWAKFNLIQASFFNYFIIFNLY